MEPRHLFVLKGDLTKLSCDGYVLPCDGDLGVARYWSPLLPDLEETGHPWPVVPGVELEGHLAEVPNADVRVVLVDTVSHPTVEDMVDAVITGIRRCRREAGSRPETDSPRVMPLIGLPLPGTGEGVFPEVRGEVCKRLIEQVNALVADLSVDVALVLKDARDYAFAQGVRRDILTDKDWAALGQRGDELAEEAEALGAAAGRGELSLFVGAGVSTPLRMPSWEGLVARLEEAVRVESSEGDLYSRAARAFEKDSEAYKHELLTFRLEKHAVVHALLANLNTGRVVTTNYDNALELALSGDQGQDSFRVMTREVPDGGSPWLLKLHGDIAHPESIVLTGQDYDDLKERSSALYGVIGTLMLTSTLVFVGSSLKDRDFKPVADQVQQVLDQADQGTGADAADPRGHAYRLSKPVALALDPDAVEDVLGVRVFVTGDEGDRQMAARRLEVMLDRMALRAAEFSATSAAYLLDDRYRGANADSAELIDRLKVVAELVEEEGTGRSVVWSQVRSTLIAFGLDAS